MEIGDSIFFSNTILLISGIFGCIFLYNILDYETKRYGKEFINLVFQFIVLIIVLLIVIGLISIIN